MVKILHLYYDLMNLYGEYGNIVVLCDQLKKNNVEYQLDKYSVGDSFEFDDYDFIYCGSGTENKTELALKDFINRKDSFIKAVNNNKHIIFTGSSIKLLGSNGVGIFNYTINNSKNRICGDVICKCNDFSNIVGYINTSYTVSNSNDEYVTIDKCDSNLKEYKGLGFKTNNLLTINITGPLLVKNPNILENVVGKLCNSFDNKTISKNQYISYNIALEELKNRFN